MASVLVEPFNTMGIRIMPNTTVSRVARADGRLQPTVELITAVVQTNRWTNASR